MTIRGSVDSLTTQAAVGWAFSGTSEPLVMQALFDGRIIGEAVADQHRADLAAAGFGDGLCGFSMSFYEPIDPAMLAFVSVKPRGGDVELPRTALSGFGDFFRSVHARHPGAGRNRSVFGGLWTDRTDAAQVLAGRIAAGSTSADLAATLGALVNQGFVVLRNALAPAVLTAAEAEALDAMEPGRPVTPEGDGRALLSALAGVFFREVALRPLRAALDDNPICYRIVPVRGTEPSFGQASTAEALPSPAECLALVACGRGSAGLTLDVVRGSHTLPEFTSDGRSRWITAGAGAGIEIAIAQGASVDQVELGPLDLAILGPGTQHRLRVAEEGVGLRAWVTPRRVTPVRFLAGEGGNFALRLPTGAALAA
jgi:hypothetical protein